MKSPHRLALAVAALCLSQVASAQECPRPGIRPPLPLQQAISQDESMAQAFEVAAGVCTSENFTCDEARSKCGTQLTLTLQKQLSFDEGGYLRDMLIAYQ